MDKSIYVMESDPSASPSQESNGSIVNSDGSDFLEDHYCTEAVGKREAVTSRSSLGLNEETGRGLISAEGPAVDAEGSAETLEERVSQRRQLPTTEVSRRQTSKILIL